MLKRLVESSLRLRGIVLALAGLLIGYGLYVASHAKLDVFPEFAPPLVVVQTEAPGLSPEEVEVLVTRPIENAVIGAGNLESVRSQSIQGLSVVTAIFQERVDIFKARQMVNERLTEAAGQMPQGVHAPTVAPLTSATSTILEIGLTSETLSPMELRTFADWTLRPRLLGVLGVAKIAIFGGEVRQLQIQVNPERLATYGLALEDLLAVARETTGVRGAGFVETEAQRIVLRTEGQALTPQALGEAVLGSHEGNPVRLKDVAQVAEAPEPKLGDASIMGQPGVILVVSSQYGANTLATTQAIEHALSEMKPAFEAEGITLYPTLFRAANFIETAMRNVRSVLALGGVLVALVLFGFLWDFRTAFISFTSIPLSLLAAVIVLDRCGASLNTLTLGGLAIAVGVVVDDAIIDVENIVRRLRENRARENPRSFFQVVLEASLEVRSAVVYATFIVALVFLPILAMSGVQGKLFEPLAVAFILAILASLAVALTVTPALCFLLLPQTGVRSEPSYIASLKRRHRRWLEGISHHPKLVMGLVGLLCLGAAATWPFFGGTFLPELREAHFIVHMSSLPGTSVQESLRLGRRVTQELLKNPHLQWVSQRVGRAEKSEDTWGTHYSELNVDLKPLHGEEAEFTQAEVRSTLAKFPGVYFAIKPFLTERIEETISGVTAEVVIKIFGDDLDLLDQNAKEVARIVSEIRGATDVQVESPSGAPQLTVRLRPDRLAEFGVQPLKVLEAIQTAYQGAVVAQTYQGNRVFEVVVLLDPAIRQDPTSIGSLSLRTSSGVLLPLKALAEISQTTGRSLVSHDGARRRQAVTLNVRGRDLVSFVEEAKQKVRSKVALPSGLYLVWGGSAEAQAKAKQELFLYSLMAGIGILLLLALVFRNGRNLLLVLVNLPFALVGGILAVFMTGGWLSVGSLVGFVTLFGITIRNSIMMISHYEHLVAVEGMPWGPEAALRGASERLVPILMTALITGFGLLPLALGSHEPGREIEGPMAIVILGGLATSTILNLLVLPTLALRYGRFEKSEQEADA